MSSKTFSQSEVFEDGEILAYDVSYSFINIGTVLFNTQKKADNFYLCKAVMKSNESLPFVYVNYEFYSEIEVSNGKIIPHKFTAYEFNKEGKQSVLTTNFNYDSDYVHIKKTGFTGDIEADKKIMSSTLFQDGLSIFYYARYNASYNGTQSVPVIMYVDTASMKINFNNSNTNVSIGAADYDISSVYLDGFAYFTAVFGLTGDFSGWFSNDHAKIPLKAKLKVKIGNVTLELKSWTRKSWTPPRY